jgi:Concanavalin A-like lectin/glucanases superfamily
MVIRSLQRACRLVPYPLATLLLVACPQLLDDDFQRLPRADPAGHAPPTTTLPDATTEAPLDTGLDGRELDAAAPDYSNPLPDGSAGSVGPDASALPILVALRSALIHRYRFDGSGTNVLDSVGSAHGVTQGALQSGGAVLLAGSGQYVDLPNGLLSSLHNATFEAWVIWTADPTAATSIWQRIFDFGNNSSTLEGAQGTGAHGLYLSPKSGVTEGKLHLEFDNNGNIRTNVDGPSWLPASVLVQVVGVVDDDADILSLYQDAVLKGAIAFSDSLSTVNDRNNWLGRSQYDGDPSFQGQILDFRIYSAALSSELIQASHAAGPDADW